MAKMNVLQEGRHSLSTEDKSNKSLYLVKLTDSALRSIETFIKSKNNSQSKLSIQFENNNGVISIQSNGRIHNYKFTLSNKEIPVNSRFQCVQDTGDNSLESIGSLCMEMKILANEDSYEQTKVKMAAVDQEQKSSCTKEIKQGSTHLSRKNTVGNLKRRPFLKNDFEFRKPIPVKPDIKSKLVNSSAKQPPIRERIIHILAVKPYQKPELLLRLKKDGINEKDKSNINEILTDVATPKGNTFTLATHLWSEVKEDWEFCSKEELQILLRRKQQFSSVAKVKHGNEIPAPKHFINNSVMENGIAEKPVITNSLLTSKEQKLSHDGNGISKPVITNGFSKKQELHHDDNEVLNLATAYMAFSKKQKLFLKDSPKHNNAIIKDDSLVPNSLNKISSINVNGNTLLPDSVKQNTNCNGIKQTTKKKSVTKSKKKKHNGQFKKDVEELLALHSSEWLIDKYFKKSKHLVPLHYIQPLPITCYPIQIGSDNGILDFNIEIDCSEIVQKYPKIESVEQRIQYVDDFDLHYQEYLQLHAQMMDISKSFSNLSNRLQASVKGSDEFKKIKREIAKEYKSTLRNSDYIPARKKYEFFKTKLSHIRKQIIEYDSTQNVNHESCESADVIMEDCNSL